jgi:hypothetical protein
MKNITLGSLREIERAILKGGASPLAGGSEMARSWLSSMAASPLLARRRWLNLFGLPGVLGAGLLAACPAFYLSAIYPAQERLNHARESAASIQERVRLASNGLAQRELTPAEQLAEFYRIFPNDKNLQPWLEKVFTLAESNGIRLDQGEYKVTRDKVGKLVRFQMTLPIRSEYPQIRKYLNSLRAGIPIMAMEHLQFERQKINDPEVEATIRLALYLEHEP